MNEILDELARHRVVAVLRAPDAGRFPATARALAAGGVTCVEVTMTSRGALESVAALREQGLVVGVGSVTSSGQAADACAAGAAFVVTPARVEGVVDRCAPHEVPVVMGTLTPSEMLAAVQEGAAAVKVFPAAAFGPDYLRQIRAPLPRLRLMPTGGITVATAAGYLRAGAFAVGLGTPLVGDADTPLDEITRRAEALVRSCAEPEHPALPGLPGRPHEGRHI
ncbi:bifunctional 4-hydroxy-2-oxoglutarate aldolase/2-dehydro-3-deoxy-phosphogluconate aldolase [Streptomyces thermoalcalitolerans]|uniref:Bifunctional 4-hydroxy-2-oxoglutarate aldolase/2-dehydro-3-deoxy-phosphogluconate aldolase n=1 Tax=Streptomyces thermoalcalitolerans TaxID=65605 RepID=A0ABP3YTW6_9ACTN